MMTRSGLILAISFSPSSPLEAALSSISGKLKIRRKEYCTSASSSISSSLSITFKDGDRINRFAAIALKFFRTAPAYLDTTTMPLVDSLSPRRRSGERERASTMVMVSRCARTARPRIERRRLRPLSLFLLSPAFARGELATRRRAFALKVSPRPRARLRPCFQFVLQLFFANFRQQPAHRRPGFHAQRQQILSGQQRRTDGRLPLQLRRLFDQELIMIQSTMGSEAIEPVQFQLQRKGRSQQHPPQGGLAHPQNIFELHVRLHANRDLFNQLPGKAQPFQQLPRNAGAGVFMAVKMNLACMRITRRGRRLANVVQQGSPDQRWR